MSVILSFHGNYVVEQVTFASSRLQLEGTLHVPSSIAGPRAAVVVVGPYASVKEHAPVQYATRLADEGHLALAFDCAHHGESAGEPRGLDEPLRKVADIRAAVDFLASRPEVDPAKLAVVGICDGAPEALRAGADDPRVRAVAAVAGHYRDHANDLGRVGGDELASGRLSVADAERRLADRLARGRAALAKFDESGEVDYLPVVDPVRSDVALPGSAAWEWYSSHAGRGLWRNRYAVMGDVAYLGFESLSAAKALQAPLLMVHGDHSSGADSARRHFDCVPHVDKRLLIEEGTSHYQYYDDPAVVDRAVASISRWFSTHW